MPSRAASSPSPSTRPQGSAALEVGDASPRPSQIFADLELTTATSSPSTRLRGEPCSPHHLDLAVEAKFSVVGIGMAWKREDDAEAIVVRI
ncbi:HNH domain-containing protein [Psidium guajava]|nr:HNH domain-containing protein [Psidium guajava]